MLEKLSTQPQKKDSELRVTSGSSNGGGSAIDLIQ